MTAFWGVLFITGAKFYGIEFVVPFFSAIVLFKNRIRSPWVFDGFPKRRTSVKEWGRYPQKVGTCFWMFFVLGSLHFCYWRGGS